ncbi:hypothetical protein BaRGS_00025880 [Batillaria attramentaria]|uniref:H-type lectin domain-containing protein n=1 Tax=Batillaria attramentaria TaxID=370345 RepID=A0ABD0K6V9_9CAEN
MASSGESGIIGLNPESHSSRTETKHITFSNAFGSTPAVTAGIIHIDSASRSSSAVRIDVQVQHVGTTGFDLTAHEWLDSHNHGVTLSWMACSN